MEVMSDEQKKKDRILKSFFEEQIEAKKFDRMINVSAFGEMNKNVLMTLEIHELMEAGKLDYVHEDNQYIIPKTMDVNDQVVLCLPTNVTYAEWREVYDALIK